LKFKFIIYYSSITEAWEKTKISTGNLTDACKISDLSIQLKTAHNFIWRYASDCIQNDDGTYDYENKVLAKRKTRALRVCQFTKNKEFVNIFESVTIACKKFKVKHIGSVCRHEYGKKTAKGYIWRYETECKKMDDNKYTYE
jgi:hypothetical protein